MKTDMVDFEESDLKLSENLSKASDALEQNFVYQFVGAVLYYIYYSQDSTDVIKLLGIELKPEMFKLFFPIGMVYLMIKMAILFMGYIELAEIFFEKVTRLNASLFTLRPRSIFLAIPLARSIYRHSATSQIFCYIGSSMIFVFPGATMSLILMSILKYENTWITIALLTVTIILFI